jgi:hypothetical protein
VDVVDQLSELESVRLLNQFGQGYMTGKNNTASSEQSTAEPEQS